MRPFRPPDLPPGRPPAFASRDGTVHLIRDPTDECSYIKADPGSTGPSVREVLQQARAVGLEPIDCDDIHMDYVGADDDGTTRILLERLGPPA